MVNKEFEAYKLKRELKKSGIKYKFSRASKNKFGEPTDELTEIGEICGLYHETNSSVSITTGDTTQTRTKKVPAILCLYDDVALVVLQVGDTVQINGKTLKVTGVVNVQEWNIIVDISLEVIDNGSNV